MYSADANNVNIRIEVIDSFHVLHFEHNTI